MVPSPFTTILGHPRVLPQVPGDDRHRVLAYDGPHVVGVAAFEPLFGHHAEAAVATAPNATGGLTPYLLDGLAELAAGAGITVLRVALVTAGQRPLAGRLAATRPNYLLRSDRLEIRTASHAHARSFADVG